MEANRIQVLPCTGLIHKDSHITSGLKWLIKMATTSYDEIQSKIELEMAQQMEEEKKQKEVKRKRLTELLNQKNDKPSTPSKKNPEKQEVKEPEEQPTQPIIVNPKHPDGADMVKVSPIFSSPLLGWNLLEPLVHLRPHTPLSKDPILPNIIPS